MEPTQHDGDAAAQEARDAVRRSLHVVSDTPSDPAKDQLDDQQRQVVEGILGDGESKGIDEISDEEALQAGGVLQGAQALEILRSLPQATFMFNGAKVGVIHDPTDDSRNLVIGPIMLTFVVPFDEQAARNVSKSLVGGIEIASAVSAADIAKAAADARVKVT